MEMTVEGEIYFIYLYVYTYTLVAWIIRNHANLAGLTTRFECPYHAFPDYARGVPYQRPMAP